MYLLLVTNEPDNPRMPSDQLDRLLRDRLSPFTAPLVVKIRDQIHDPSHVIYGPIEEVILPPPWYPAARSPDRRRCTRVRPPRIARRHDGDRGRDAFWPSCWAAV